MSKSERAHLNPLPAIVQANQVGEDLLGGVIGAGALVGGSSLWI